MITTHVTGRVPYSSRKIIKGLKGKGIGERNQENLKQLDILAELRERPVWSPPGPHGAPKTSPPSLGPGHPPGK